METSLLCQKMTKDHCDLSKTLVDSHLIQHANKLGINLRSATQAQKPIGLRKRENNPSAKRNSIPIGWIKTVHQRAYVDDSLIRHHSHNNRVTGHTPSTVSFELSENPINSHSDDPYSYLYSGYNNPQSPAVDKGAKKINAWSTCAQWNHTVKPTNVEVFDKTNNSPHPHQVDMRYYLGGLKLPLFSRYCVDAENLRHLKNLARVRKKAPHYGKGLSKYKYWGLSTATHLPAPHDFTEEEHAIVNQIMISKRSGYSKDYYSDDQLTFLKHIFDNKVDDFRTTLDQSNQSWMHIQPPPSPQQALCVICSYYQEFREYFEDHANSWNLQLPDISDQQKHIYHQGTSTALAKYAEGWNKPQMCDCRTSTGAPQIDGVFGHPAPTRNCSPQSTNRDKQ